MRNRAVAALLVASVWRGGPIRRPDGVTREANVARGPNSDMRDIFAYLETVKPVQHDVNNVDAPTFCRRCGRRHGSGNLNKPADVDVSAPGARK